MHIVNKFKGLTGAELLKHAGESSEVVDLNGEMTSIIPMTMPFCNRGEIASIDEATHVAVQTRFMDNSIMVRV